jgi:hypothetical protein
MDPIIVNMPDGSRVNFPAGTPHEEINRALQERFGQAKPYTPGPRMSYGKEAGHVINQFAGGVNEGLLDAALGINPIRAMAQPLEVAGSLVSRAFGGPDVAPVSNFFGSIDRAGRDYVRRNAGAPETDAGYVAGRAGSTVGQSLPLMGAGLVAAPAHMARQALMPSVPPSSTGAAVTDTMMRSIAQHPVATAITDTLSSASSGGAGGVANLMSPTGQANPITRAIFETVGGMLPAVTAPAVAFDVARDVRAARRGQDSTIGNIFNRIRGASNDVAERKAGGFVGEQITANADEVARVGQVAADVPGFQPTKAQQAGSQSILRTQDRIEGGLSGKELDAATGVYDKNVAAIQDKIRTASPVAPENAPEAVASAMERRVADLEARLAASEAAAKAKIETTQGALPTEAPRPGTADKPYDPKAAGDTLRTERNVIKDKLDRDTAAMKAAVDPEGKLNVPAEELRAAVQADLEMRGNALTGAPDEPALLKKLLGPKGDTPEMATFTDLQDYRSDVQRRIREMSAAAQPDYAKIEQLKGVVSRIDESVKAGAAKAGDPEIVKRYDQFREFYKDEVVPRVGQDVGRDIGRRTPQGDLKVKSEDIPKKFFSPGGQTEAIQFQKLYGHNAPAVETMTDHALASLRDSMPDGITQAGIDAWKRKHASVLKEIPEVRAAVDKINVADAEKRLATVDTRRQMVSDSDLAKRVGDPAKAVKDAMGDPKLMRTLRRTVGADKDGQAALKRMVWEHAAGDGKDLPSALGKIDKILGDATNRKVLEIAGFSRDDLKNLKTIRDAIEIQGRVERPVGRGQDPKETGIVGKIKDAVGIQPSTAVGAYTGVARGRSSELVEGANMLTRFLKNASEKQQDAFLKRMIWDGRLASDVAETIKTGAMKPDAFRRLNSYLATIPGEDKEKK